MKLYIGLLHYPVYNKNHHRIASAITNLDLHDLSRLSKTYGVKGFFVITPLEDQQRFAGRILKHWIMGYGAQYNPFRKEALELVEIKSSLQDAMAKLEKMEDDLKKREREIEELKSELKNQKAIIIEKDKEMESLKGGGSEFVIDEDTRKLLKILDDLLDKLPEEVVDKFANSNDYLLYEKVLEKFKI